MPEISRNVENENTNSNSTSTSQAGCGSKKVDLLEVIFTDIGGTFGKYQIINFILFCLPFALSGSFGLSYVFTALNIDHRWVFDHSVRNWSWKNANQVTQNAIVFKNIFLISFMNILFSWWRSLISSVFQIQGVERTI